MRYEPTGTPLTEREREIVENLAEEATEVAQAALKVLRFGKEDPNPHNGESSTYKLGKEVGNFIAMVNLAAQDKLIIQADVQEGEQLKLERLAIYTRQLP